MAMASIIWRIKHFKKKKVGEKVLLLEKVLKIIVSNAAAARK